MKTAAPYFTETQPLIHQRLLRTTRIIWVMSIIMFIVSLIHAASLYMESMDIRDPHFLHQALASLLFFPYIPIMIYAEHTAKTRPRLGTQITLITTFIVLTNELIINGNEAIYVMFALPVLLVLSGFFTNVAFARLSTIATTCLISLLALFELVGVNAYNPSSQGYFSLKSLLFITLVLFVVYVSIQIIVRDFFTIQSNLIEQKQQAEQIAIHDTLTGLHNRYYIEKSFDQFFDEKQPHEKGFILFLDIDNFKMINTRFGHEGGDYALQVIAKRLKDVTNHNQATACRLGGDEFIVLLNYPPDQVHEVSQQLLNTVSKPFELFEETLHITCSIGIARVGSNSHFSDAYRQANTAMDRAKYAGKNTQIEHLQAYSDEELERAKVLSRLQLALNRNEFKLHYQPQVDLKSGTIIGMEALIRWEMDGKERPPGDFIDLAEQYGLIHTISEWVIQQACQDCKRVHDAGYPHIMVAVNISALLLERNSLVNTVKTSLLESGLPASSLELELTESTLFQQGQTTGTEQLQQIRQLGVELSIDDFGTGYSNLHYLGQLDIQRLKIDRSFVVQLHDSPKDRDLIAVVIDIAKRFQLKTVAEGIETTRDAAILLDMQCDVGQGYYWSRPIAIEPLLKMLDDMQSMEDVKNPQLTQLPSQTCA